jgi:hypothetical protein
MNEKQEVRSYEGTGLPSHESKRAHMHVVFRMLFFA